MDAAGRTGDRDLIGVAVDTLLATLTFGWDGEYGGIFAFRTRKGSRRSSSSGTRNSGGCTSSLSWRSRWGIVSPAGTIAWSGL